MFRHAFAQGLTVSKAIDGTVKGFSQRMRIRQRDLKNQKELVEAAGIEPASEKARRQKPTCVSDSFDSAAT